jgi:hypothetical protein
MCNINGEYDGRYGVKYWPPVYPEGYSEAKCGDENNTIRWLCLSNGSFDDNGPRSTECLIHEIIDKNITDINDVIEYLYEIKEVTENDESLVYSDELREFVDYLVKLQNFVDSDESEMDFETAFNITKMFLKNYSNLINQNIAWIKTKSLEKAVIASKIMLYIQYTFFTAKPFFNGQNETIIIENKNIFVKIYATNCSEELIFKTNGSSIQIPKDFYFIDSEECYNYSVGYLINRLGDYLSENISELYFNSKIIALSIGNTNNSQDIRDGLKVKIRYSF